MKVNIKDYPENVIKNMCLFYTPKKINDNSKKRQIFVAVENEKIIGTASLENNFVMNVFVKPGQHGKGVGTKLMNKVEREAKKKGYNHTILNAILTAYEFYKKINYKKIKRIHDDFCGEAIKMKKEFSISD